MGFLFGIVEFPKGSNFAGRNLVLEVDEGAKGLGSRQCLLRTACWAYRSQCPHPCVYTWSMFVFVFLFLTCQAFRFSKRHIKTSPAFVPCFVSSLRLVSES